jgi:predicted transcriptional regulator of viral defense system
MIHKVGYDISISDVSYHIWPMTSAPDRQQDRAISLLKQRGIVRLSELTEAGITATTVSRMKEKGLLLRLGRGLYQLPDSPLDVNHSLAEAAKLVPRGVVCLVTALAFHELTDTIPSRVWMAIGPKDRRPRAAHPALQFVRFRDKMLRSGMEEHLIEGVRVRIYDPAKTVVDLFRYRRRAGKRYQKSPGLNLALEGLREVLRRRKATPAEIARYAIEGGIWKVVQPYLDAMTAYA